MAQRVVAIDNTSPGSSVSVKNPYAFCHDLISILREPSVIFRISIPEQNIRKQETSSEFHVEVAPQNLRKITAALNQAEELQKKAEDGTNTDLLEKLHQTNEEISEWISQELPAMVLLAFIEDYCQQQVKALTQIEQQHRERIRRGENIAVSCLLVGALFMACIGVLFTMRYHNPILFLLLLAPGLCLELIGIYCLRGNAERRRKLNKILQRRTSLHRFRMMPLIIEEIADQEEKQAIMQDLLINLLKDELIF